MMAFTLGDLRSAIEHLTQLKVPDDEPIVCIIDDGATGLDELEEGSILDITEVGGYMQGMRLIRVKPR